MTEKEKLERRESLSDEAIEDVVKKTLQHLNGEKDIIAKRATDRAVEEISKKYHLDFKNDEEKRKFKESIPQLIEMNNLLIKTKKRVWWVLVMLLAWALQDVFDWVWETGQALFHWLDAIRITKGN